MRDELTEAYKIMWVLVRISAERMFLLSGESRTAGNLKIRLSDRDEEKFLL